MIVTISNLDTTIDLTAKDTDRIIQNVKNILRTKKYEVPFDREFGINPDFVDNPIHTIMTDIEADIKETIEKYESRVSVLNVTLNGVDENGNANISVELEV